MTPREALIVLRNMLLVLRDSQRSQEIIESEDIICRAQFARLGEALRKTPAGAELLRDRPELNPDIEALTRLPDGTLGREYARHLRVHGLNPGLLMVPAHRPGEPDSAYLQRRYRSAHDVWHVLLGLGTQGYEEVLVHTFALGQLNLRISQLIVGFGVPKHMLLEGRYRTIQRALLPAWRMGRRARPLVLERWEEQWAVDVRAVRARTGVRSLRARA